MIYTVINVWITTLPHRFRGHSPQSNVMNTIMKNVKLFYSILFRLWQDWYVSQPEDALLGCSRGSLTNWRGYQHIEDRGRSSSLWQWREDKDGQSDYIDVRFCMHTFELRVKRGNWTVIYWITMLDNFFWSCEKSHLSYTITSITLFWNIIRWIEEMTWIDVATFLKHLKCSQIPWGLWCFARLQDTSMESTETQPPG